MAIGKRRAAKDATTMPAAGPEAPPLEHIVGYLLRRAHYVYHTYWLSHFRATETPITPMQAGVMLMLQRHPLATQSELARLLGIEAPTAFNLIAKLIAPGYIERIPNGADKRAHMLRLTPAGLQTLGAIGEGIQARDAELLADFTPAERALLAKLLTRIIINGAEHLGISQQVVNAQIPAAEEAPETVPRNTRPGRPARRGWRGRPRTGD